VEADREWKAQLMDDMLEALGFPKADAWVLVVDPEYGMELIICDGTPEIDANGQTYRRTLSRQKVGASPFVPFKAAADGTLVDAGPVFRKPEGVAASRMREEVRLTLMPTGARLVLNSSARRIWDLCDGHSTSRQIARKLAWHYGVDEGLMLPDVDFTLRSLHSGGALVAACG
jgi:hypothetical protein